MSNNENSEDKQDTEETKTLENKKAIAETQKAIAEAQKASAEAQKAAVEALIPSAKLGPQEGKTETDQKFGYIAELVAYQTLKESAKKIGEEIDSKLKSDNDNKKILIVKNLDFATEDLPLLHIETLFNYYTSSMDKQIAENERLKAEVLPTPSKAYTYAVAGPILIAGAAIGAIADIIGYFKTDYKIAGQDFELEEHAIIANVASNIKSCPVHLFKFNLIDSSQILTEFKNLVDKRTELQKSIAHLKSMVIKKLNADIQKINQNISQLDAALAKQTSQAEKKKTKKKIAKTKEDLKKKSAKLEEANSQILDSETLLTAFSTFVESINKIPEDKSPSLLLKAILRKHIRTNKFTHLLNLKILSSGGEAITMQQRLWKSGKLIFIGGCATSYMLVKTDGTYVTANTHHGLSHLNYDLKKPEKSIQVHNISTLDQLDQQTPTQKIIQLLEQSPELTKKHNLGTLLKKLKKHPTT